MSKPSDISEVVFYCIEQLNKQLPASKKLTKSANSVLAGENGTLDSLGLITLCVNIEQELQDRLNFHCAVLDELMIEQKEHPMRTIGTMVGWIERQAMPNK